MMAAGQQKVSAVERQVFLAWLHALRFHVHFVGRLSTLRLLIAHPAARANSCGAGLL